MPANKSAMMRYNIIDDCLRNSMRPYPTMDQIRERIQSRLDISISESMINKDIGEMKKLYQAPIKYDRTRKGYCYKEPDFSIRKFPLREDEILALDQSIAVLRQIRGSSLFAHFESAINKIIQGFRISEITGGNDRSYIQVEEPLVSESNEWIEPLLQGIVEGQLLTVDYKGFGKDPKRHPFSPYLLKQYRNRWYVVGHSKRGNRTMVLALDRIAAIEPSRKGEHFRDPAFDPEQYFTHSFGITHLSDQEPEEVRLMFTQGQAPYILSQPLHHSQKTEKLDSGDIMVSLRVFVTQELVMTILSYGVGVKVLSPASLVDRIRDISEAMARQYDD
jgi:predicted DNA-binding transcriptional regulator YafY